MKNRSKTKVIFRNFEKQRAEMFKNLGYFLFSLLGLYIIKLFFRELELQFLLDIRGAFLIIFFYSGSLCIEKSLAIMENLDLVQDEKKG